MMAGKGQLTTEEREAIVAALRAGVSQNAAAKQFGRGPATVNRLAVEYGLEYSAPNNAAACLRDYAQAERLRLVNKFFAKAEAILDEVDRPAQLQALAIALGILIDKRRLEDGEATSRSEVSTDDSRDRIARRVDELAARRGAKELAS